MKTLLRVILTAALALCSALAAEPTPAARSRPIDGIMDNSFLIEEAYNQEAGVVQHIFTALYSVDKLRGRDDRSWAMSFTQEWPFFDQTHQLSYTVPYSFLESGGQRTDGIGDVLLNYRWQAFFDERSLTAFAPRLSLIVPTGDSRRGFGDDTLGYQLNLPFSTTLRERWFFHANAGLTWLPNAAPSPRRDLVHYNLGGSVIYAATCDLHFLVECVGNFQNTRTGRSALDREFECVVSPGVRRAFNFRDDSQLVLGLAAPIGVTRAAPDFGVLFYVSFEHAFLKKR